MRDGFPTATAAEISGLSVNTLENWTRTKFLCPSVVATGRGRGETHKYSFRDVVALRVAGELREAGISLQALRRVTKYLRMRKGLSATEVLASTSLITDGIDVYEAQGEVTISALRRPGQRVVFVVPLDELVAEIQAKARALRPAA